MVDRLMGKLKLPVNAEKTRCLRCPGEPLEFLGYRIGWSYRPKGGGRYIGTRPSKASVQSICHRISEHTDCRRGRLEAEEVVGRLNRMISGWANYFDLGQVNPAYAAVDQHTIRRLRQWVWRKHKVRSGRMRPHGPCDENQVPSVGEGVIPTESRMRETCTSGSTRRGWRRTYDDGLTHRRESGRETLRTLRAPRHLLTLRRLWLKGRTRVYAPLSAGAVTRSPAMD